MACFLVPVAEAIVTTIVEKALKSTEKKAVVKLNSADGTALEVSKTPFSAKLGWLNKLLWGGSALLAFEHVWHGEIVPFFPFLTAVKSGETGEMLAEMGSAGVMMPLPLPPSGSECSQSPVLRKRNRSNHPQTCSGECKDDAAYNGICCNCLHNCLVQKST